MRCPPDSASEYAKASAAPSPVSNATAARAGYPVKKSTKYGVALASAIATSAMAITLRDCSNGHIQEVPSTIMRMRKGINPAPRSA